MQSSFPPLPPRPTPWAIGWQVAEPFHRFRFRQCFLIALAGVSALLVAGCRQKTPTTSNQQSQQSQLRQVNRSEALLKATAQALADLPDATDLEMHPPIVVMDSRNSSDRQDAYAICVPNPAIQGGPINVLHVASNNGRFKGLGVGAGDLLKFFVIEDETVDEESRQTGMSRQKAMNLKVARVLDDNNLLIIGALSQAVEIPGRLEVWRTVDVRQKDVIRRLDDYAKRRIPALGWEPAPDEKVVAQIRDWLNQWIRQSNPPSEWKREPLLDSLPKDLLAVKEIKAVLSAENLAAKSFETHDSRIVQEAVWLRDISRWAHGEAFDDVGRALALFDWTVRNIQLENDADAVPHRPWHTLLYGRGSADQRAWVFAGLCRQQGLNVVILGIPLAKPTDGAAADSAKTAGDTYWLAALLADNKFYLFDPRLGLAIPGPEGKGVATLEQVSNDDALLRKMDVEGFPYPLTAELAKNAQVFIIADPFELSRRASQLEASLTGEDHLVLSVKTGELTSQLKAVPGVTTVALWEVPFRTLQGQLTLGKEARTNEALAFEPFAVRPTLWKARVRHFQGRRKAATTADADEINDHEEAVRLYMSKSVRPTDREIAASPSDGEQRVERVAKTNATYWLGLVTYDDGKFGVAAHWFQRPEAAKADSVWATGAKYNLARSLEAEQKYEEAATILEKDASPQQHGNKWRARDLRSRPAAAKPADAAK